MFFIYFAIAIKNFQNTLSMFPFLRFNNVARKGNI